MLVAASLLMTYLACGQLALAYARHHRAAFGRPPSKARARRMRIAGGVLLVVSPIPWIIESGFGVGFTTWLWYALPCVAVALVALLAFAPRAAARLALVPVPRP